MQTELPNHTAVGKEKEHQIKIGPPVQKNSVPKKTTLAENPRVTEQSKEPLPKARQVPYVDVPPLRTALRAPVIEPVKEDQTLTKNGPAYKSRAPVEMGLDIEKIVEAVLDMEINIPLKSLAGVSAAVQKEIKKQVTKAHVPIENDTEATMLVKTTRPMVRVEDLPTAEYMINMRQTDEVPEGHFIAHDPVLQYLTNHKDVDPGEIVVARPSDALRAIYLKINRIGQEECLLDNGSMIVSMAKAVAIQLGLTWDPSICINMESASSHFEKTLGLARNVLFGIGGLDLFLQVHILENPPYRVLLGRPFDSFTQSTIRTKTDGSSEIELTDPNTKMTVNVPTYQRGVGPEQLQQQRLQAFHETSMNP